MPGSYVYQEWFSASPTECSLQGHSVTTCATENLCRLYPGENAEVSFWRMGYWLNCFALYFTDHLSITSLRFHCLYFVVSLILDTIVTYISSVQFSCSVMSTSLPPHKLQQARPPCPSPAPRAYPNSCPLSRWCHPTISSSVVPFSSCPQSFPASGSFQMSQLFESGGQNIGVSASTSVLPMNTQDWSPLALTSWISLQSRGLSRVFSNTTVQKHQFFGAQLCW